MWVAGRRAVTSVAFCLLLQTRSPRG